ncbi:4-oxalomesaconate tautomerase [Phytobacter diazotrophicus]|uniref:4-oxalomesaconate tautomerase n=1 Tax=Phytobacter diazotrophicus TaxID=395631 RepID=UPI001C999034|nr:4-oxalomesaconate tautomerase [Phytobacter diazotrophicus]MBY6254914.1 4-oxalomesaconate tautomerase [Phytobacter diazotrophicus]MBY6255209.1 4-oxalomesaconate tautomerase [Phytobacter diazotrophicus]
MFNIPCVLMRGGTSKGPVILASDLPTDVQERDAVLLALMGAGHELEIDGIGGGSPQTSKVAIVSRSESPDADIDYLFAQVMVKERRVDTTPNCGNMLCAVGPFAIEKGLVAAKNPVTAVRIRNLNTGTFVDAEVQTPDYKVCYEGDTQIDGVPGAAAPVGLTFLNSAGCKTGKLLPTGNTTDVFEGVEVTCIDMAMPMILIDAQQMDKTGGESPAELEADLAFMQRLEKIRRKAGEAMGFGDVSDKVIPKPVLLSKPTAGGTIKVRYFMPHNCHKSLAITGSIGISTATIIDGSVAQKIISGQPKDAFTNIVNIEHPSGKITVSLLKDGNKIENTRAAVIRTTRKLFEGSVYVPEIALAEVI